jgi:hypothetical protein
MVFAMIRVFGVSMVQCPPACSAFVKAQSVSTFAPAIFAAFSHP